MVDYLVVSMGRIRLAGNTLPKRRFWKHIKSFCSHWKHEFSIGEGLFNRVLMWIQIRTIRFLIRVLFNINFLFFFDLRLEILHLISIRYIYRSEFFLQAFREEQVIKIILLKLNIFYAFNFRHLQCVGQKWG